MLAIEREFGWPVAEQVGAVAEGRYTREINREGLPDGGGQRNGR
jgi:hypothetical protein